MTTSAASRPIYNTHDQMMRADSEGHRWPFAIVRYSAAIRSPKRQGAWAIYHPLYKFDTRFWLHDHVGTFHQRKAAALAAAQRWIAENHRYIGKWASNRAGAYVPADIQKQWPIPKRS